MRMLFQGRQPLGLILQLTHLTQYSGSLKAQPSEDVKKLVTPLVSAQPLKDEDHLFGLCCRDSACIL